ncbi:MAG: beta-propeller domain-containing protein [Candidatus Pacearchaeota archaeon]
MTKDDKFILMGIDDDRSKDIADVISNKTCKKIIDYLSEVREASEKDISDALSIPINTVEYNLNKLIKTGLVEKAKNFFWSRKGKKINMYKLAKKHIVISPKSSKNVDIRKLSTILSFILIAAIMIIGVIYLIPNLYNISKVNSIYRINDTDNLKKFSSIEELKDFLNSRISDSNNYYSRYGGGVNSPESSIFGAVQKSSRDSSSSYSHTNIQVEGVDEPDIVKTDGKYIYTLSDDKVIIVDSYPPDNMKKVSEINIKGVFNIFVNDNKLIIFSQSYSTEVIPYFKYDTIRCFGRCSWEYARLFNNVLVYDIKDKSNPVLERNISIEGSYVDARMIGDYVYLVSQKNIIDEPFLPKFSVNGLIKEIPLSKLYYSDYYDNDYVFTSIFSININNDEIDSKTYLTGSTNEIFVSNDNIYLTYPKSFSWREYVEKRINEVYLKILPDDEKEQIKVIMNSSESLYEKNRKINLIVSTYSMNLRGAEKEAFDKLLMDELSNFSLKMRKEMSKSIIHKINFKGINLNYIAAGEVPGYILNQFSMDEYKGNFRVATTVGEFWNENSVNNLYILDEDLKIIGNVEDLAEGEKIYSVRFLGDRAYIVTFKNVDPLFVIDVSNPKSPKVLGYLKIPGYSNYLHPYDENHLIGIGKDAVEDNSGGIGMRKNFAWYKGLKISLFDISDVKNPIEESKYIIGDRGTDSPVLYDHKAFLFDKKKNLLVIPVSVAEINRSKYKECVSDELRYPDSYNYCLTESTYGELVWQGVYVFNIDSNSINLKGKISHIDVYEGEKYGPAKNEPIGAKRKDENGNVWTKFNIIENYGYIYGQWKTDSNEYKDVIYSDYEIDNFPGGINYNPYLNYKKEIKRSIFMDDYLYTISLSRIKANSLLDLSDIKNIDL